jgi:4-amino-4-deoxy-L-arabinose transferase-like glycosyltransferase
MSLLPESTGHRITTDTLAFGRILREKGPLLRSLYGSRAGLLVALISALLVLPTVGHRIVQSGDEARFPLLARDMLERGVWFNAEVRGHVFREKPPLYPWLIAILATLQGRMDEGTAQAPVAVAAIATVWLTALLGQQLFSPRTGLWAGLILATSNGFFVETQAVLPDMLLVSFMMAAGYAFWRAMVRPNGRRALVGFYAAVAMAVFAKGPVGLLPVLVAAAWLYSEYGPAGLRRLWNATGLAVFVLVSSIWAVPYLRYGSQSFARDIIWMDWLDWYLSRPNGVRIAEHVGDAVMRFLPWSVLVPIATVFAARMWRHPSVRYVALWVALIGSAVLLCSNFRTRYLLPLYPGLALLVAAWADAVRPPASLAARLTAGVSILVGGAGLVTLLFPGRYVLPYIGFLEGAGWRALPLGLGLGLATAALAWGLWSGRSRLLLWGVTAGALMVLTYGNSLQTDWANRIGDFRGLAAAVEREAQGGAIGIFGGRFFEIDFYLGRPLIPIYSEEEFQSLVDREDRPVVVVNGRTWRAIQGRVPAGLRVAQERRVRGHDFLILRRLDPAALDFSSRLRGS